MHNYKASLLKPNELHNRDNEVSFISSLIQMIIEGKMDLFRSDHTRKRAFALSCV